MSEDAILDERYGTNIVFIDFGPQISTVGLTLCSILLDFRVSLNTFRCLYDAELPIQISSFS